MIVSRALPALKAAKLLSNRPFWRKEVARHSHDFYYRKSGPVNPKLELCAEIGMGYAWWWFLWHIWTEPEHLYGEFPYPDPSKWSDAELGIPA